MSRNKALIRNRPGHAAALAAQIVQKCGIAAMMAGQGGVQCRLQKTAIGQAWMYSIARMPESIKKFAASQGMTLRRRVSERRGPRRCRRHPCQIGQAGATRSGALRHQAPLGSSCASVAEARAPFLCTAATMKPAFALLLSPIGCICPLMAGGRTRALPSQGD